MMCTGAIINAKIKRVCFATFDLKYGTIISNQYYKDDKKVIWSAGLLKEESALLLKKYFDGKRRGQ